MAGLVKIPLGMEVDRGPGVIVFHGDSAPLSLKGHSLPLFSLCLLWPNCWMDQDATWYGGRPRPKPHCVYEEPAHLPPKGHSPQFSTRVYCGQTVAHLSYCWALVCLCMKYLRGTTERICTKFTQNTCLVPCSDEFEGQGQKSRSPWTKTSIFWPVWRPACGGNTSLASSYHMQSTAWGSDFGALCDLFVCVWNISGTAEWIVPNSQERRVWSLARTSLSVKVKGQGHQGRKWHFPALSAACLRFVFVKSSFASSFKLLNILVYLNLYALFLSRTMRWVLSLYVPVVYSQSSNLLNNSRLKVLKAREDHIEVQFLLLLITLSVKSFGISADPVDMFMVCTSLAFAAFFKWSTVQASV